MEIIFDNYCANIPGFTRWNIFTITPNQCLNDITMIILKKIHEFKKNSIMWPIKPPWHKEWLLYPNWFKTIEYYHNKKLPTNVPFMFLPNNIKNIKIKINYSELVKPITWKHLHNNINYLDIIDTIMPNLPRDIIIIIMNYIFDLNKLIKNL